MSKMYDETKNNHFSLVIINGSSQLDQVNKANQDQKLVQIFKASLTNK